MRHKAAGAAGHNARYGTLFYEALQAVRLTSRDGVALGEGDHLPLGTLGKLCNEPAERVGGALGVFSDLFEALKQEADDPKLVMATFGYSHALRVVDLVQSCFHAVSITMRVNWKRVIGGPTLRDLQAFREAVGVPLRDAPVGRPNVRHLKNPDGTHSAENVIKWLWASRHLMDSQKAYEAARDFARVLAHTPGEVGALRAGMLRVNRETLRKARVRFDCVQMLMIRRLWATMDLDGLHCFLFSDASPQWHGWELCASTIDVVYDNIGQRFMLPMVELAQSMLDLTGIL